MRVRKTLGEDKHGVKLHCLVGDACVARFRLISVWIKIRILQGFALAFGVSDKITKMYKFGLISGVGF